MKRVLGLTLIAMLMLAGGLVVGRQIGGNNHPAGVVVAAGTGSAPSWVVQKAKQTAVDNGDALPASAQVVLTTRKPAHELVTGAVGGSSNQPTYLVVLQGHFADTHARTPDGRTIYGTILTLNIDAATQGVLDFGLAYNAPPLHQLGTIIDITSEF